MSVNSTLTESPAPTGQPAPAALPRLLVGVPLRGALSLEEHIAIHGPLPATSGRGRRRARERAALLIDEIERSGLLGHGGAAFPTATKMQAVASARRRAIVVVNAAEGEPASRKDRTLLERLPHLVLDGAILVAGAVGADEVIVCACESAKEGIESMARAIEERAVAAERAPRVHLNAVPNHYVAGQESAMVNYLNGGPAKPTFTPPLPFEQGVRRRPTLVNNAETLAHVALIARHGASWFRQLGTPSQPGSALVTLSGPLADPGVYEIEHGASLASLIKAAGGSTARTHGALIGGYAGSWVAGELLNGVALSNEHLAAHGASLGAGVVLLLSERACPVAETARIARWLAGQSTRQCGPCVHGLDALATTIEEIAGGVVQAQAGQRIGRLASLTAGRGACGHPDGAVNLILSALETFEAEFAEHARHGPCDRCARPPELPMPARPVSQESTRGMLARR
ncbi:MAG TPA: NADH-ubiquinone oxidoreductase-F iron-sulfur binding region domain-containing protein [Solirubrobacteraceae bacterium]|nr:NADH-ubiquinone oxidoreductase-F iron-sulfur binding region domain-containing protein [Solirubrobacteraceae bacterium]